MKGSGSRVLKASEARRDAAKQLEHEQPDVQLHNKQVSPIRAVKVTPEEMPPQPTKLVDTLLRRDAAALRLREVEASKLHFENATSDEATAIAARELRCYVRVSL